MINALTDTLTAEKLAAEPEFVALCAVWQVERHCPLVMPDYLRGLGCERAAMVAVWAVNHATADGYRLFPGLNSDDQIVFMRPSELEWVVKTPLPACFHIPRHKRKSGQHYHGFKRGFFHCCIADLFLNADPKTFFRTAPPEPEFCVIEL